MKNYRFYVSLGCFALAFVLLSLFMTSCANEADKRIEVAADLYRQSIEYKVANKPIMAQDKLKKTLREYQTIIDNFPNSSADIEYILHQIWEKNYKPPAPAKPDYISAGLVLEKLAENFPKGFWTSNAKNSLWLIASDEQDKHNYEEARRAYQELIDNFPNDAGSKGAWYELGEVNYKLGNYEETRKAFRVFISQSRVLNSYMGREARRLIAQSYLDQRSKDYHQAYLNFDKLTTAAFKDDTKLQAEAMYKTAYCLKQLRDNNEALGRYAEFMTRFPDSKYITDAYFDLGSLYADNMKDYELAHFNYNRALHSPESPNHSKAEIQLQIGHTYYNQGSNYFEKASNVYNRLLQEYPESEQVRMASLLIAHIHRREKRVDEAIRAYEGIIANHAEGKPVYFNIDDGLPLWVWGNLIASSYSEIGEAFSIKKDFERAFNSYARIVRKPAGNEQDFRKDPLAPFALYEAMVALCNLGRENELKTFATNYINAFGDIKALGGDELILSAEAQLKFADVLRGELKQYDKAAAEYAKLQDYPPKPYLRLNLIKLRGKYYEGFCYENGTTLGKSVETYQEAIRLFNAIFQPIIDTPNIQYNITEDEFDYCIQTAKEYGKKIRRKLKGPRQNLGDGTGKAEDSSDENITSIALASTVFLNLNRNNGIGMGSGFFIGPDLIATNYHVIEGAVEGTAKLVGGTKMSYAIVGYTAVDPDRDLAILKVRAFDVKPLSLGNSDNVGIDDNVYAVGTPLGRSDFQGTVSHGKISGVRTYPTGKQLQMTTPISPGNSGGPVLSSKGEVVGVAVSQVLYRDPRYLVNRVQNLNFAVPVNDLKALLKRVGPLKSLSDLEVVN